MNNLNRVIVTGYLGTEVHASQVSFLDKKAPEPQIPLTERKTRKKA